MNTTAQDKREHDINGWFEVKDNPISKEGVFPYKGYQITLADGTTPPNKDQSYAVYRSADELQDPETIDSFKLVPWVDDHTMLGSEDLGMTPAEKKGISGVVGEDVYFKDGTLYGNIKAFSEALARRIDSGKKELSLGYRCEYEHKPGTWNGQPYEYVQKKIRGNHLALVDQGRMGAEVRVMDHKDSVGHFVFVCDSQMEKIMAENTSNTPEGGGSSDVSLEEVITQLKALTTTVAALKQNAEQDSDIDEPVTDNTPDDEKPAEVQVPDDESVTVPDESNDDPLDQLLKTMDSIYDKVQSVEGRLAKLEGTSDEEDPEAKDDDDEDKTAAMDAAEMSKSVMQRIANRDKLYSRVSKFTGAFDCSAMDAADVAAYGCKKLGLKVPNGQETAALTGYMAKRQPDSEKPSVSTGMDSGSQSSFLDKQFSSKGA